MLYFSSSARILADSQPSKVEVLLLTTVTRLVTVLLTFNRKVIPPLKTLHEKNNDQIP